MRKETSESRRNSKTDYCAVQIAWIGEYACSAWREVRWYTTSNRYLLYPKQRYSLAGPAHNSFEYIAGLRVWTIAISSISSNGEKQTFGQETSSTSEYTQYRKLCGGCRCHSCCTQSIRIPRSVFQCSRNWGKLLAQLPPLYSTLMCNRAPPHLYLHQNRTHPYQYQPEREISLIYMTMPNTR